MLHISYISDIKSVNALYPYVVCHNEKIENMKIRREISKLPIGSQELNSLLKAFIELKKAQQDDFNQIAGLHGKPNPSNCPHHLPHFLPWHRLFVTDLENRLNLFSSEEISLPFWDWTSQSAISNGIPLVFTLEKIEIDGVEMDNPLHSTLINDLERRTSRNPGNSSDLTYLSQQVGTAISRKKFSEFTNDIETPHDWFHGWVGGNMGSVAYAAFDPIFWFHHCNVDRQWAVWQLLNGNGSMPESLLNETLAIYEKTIKETLSTDELGFTYEEPENLVVEIFQPQTMSIDDLFFKNIELPKPKKEILLSGLKMTKETFELRIFADIDATSESPKEGRFISSIVLLGMDGAMNPNGFMGTFTRSIDITNSFPEIKSVKEIKIVPVDLNGKPVSLDKIPLESVSIKSE